LKAPWTLKTEAQADITIGVVQQFAVLSVRPAMAPGMADIGVMLTLAELGELQQALGKAAAHLRGLKRAA
jgi:hypothetical protein